MKQILIALITGNLYWCKGHFIIHQKMGRLHFFNIVGLPKKYKVLSSTYNDAGTDKEAWNRAKISFTGTLERAKGKKIPVGEIEE